MSCYDDEEKKIEVPRFEESAGSYTSRQRSYNMSRIKGKDSKPEMIPSESDVTNTSLVAPLS